MNSLRNSISITIPTTFVMSLMNRTHWIQVIGILIVTACVYTNMFANQFVVDDHVFIGVYHPNVQEAFLGVVPKGHEGVYRPVRGLFYTAYYALWGTNPIGYHASALAVHLLSTLLVYFICLEITRTFSLRWKWFAFVSALAFGLHPVHTEAITYIAASMDSIGIIFFFASFYAYLKQKTALSIVLALAAFFTTEITLTLPCMIIFYEWVTRKLSWKRVWKYLWYVGGAVIYLCVRFFIVHITTRGPYLANSFYLTMITMTKVLVEYVKVLVWPFTLVQNHMISPGIEAFVYRDYRTVAIAAQSLFDPDILFSLLVIGSLIFLIFRVRKRAPIVSLGIGWFFLSLLPVMEFIPQGSMMNEKSAYISSFGWVIILAWGIAWMNHRWKKGVVWCVLGIFAFYGVQTVSRNRDWKNDTTLWQADIRVSPNENAYAYFALGNAYNDQKMYQRARDAYTTSVQINPGFAVGWASLGRTSADMGEVDQAIMYYTKALSLDPNFWEVQNNLNNIYKQVKHE